jgi:hypothetical protein
LHCSECGADCTGAGFPNRPGDGCTHQPSFLDQISVHEVLEEVVDLVSAVRAIRPAREQGVRGVQDRGRAYG